MLTLTPAAAQGPLVTDQCARVPYCGGCAALLRRLVPPKPACMSRHRHALADGGDPFAVDGAVDISVL